MNTEVETTEIKQSPLAMMSDRLSIDPVEMQNIIMKTVMPNKGSGVTNEQFVAFLAVANTYGLDPLKKEIYAFPNKGAIQPIVSIDGWLLIINSHKSYDGMLLEEKFDSQGNILSVTCTIFRKDKTHPTTITEYFQECVMQTQPWKTKPIRMLRHKALIQCARYAFGLSGIMDEDDGNALVANNEKEINPGGISRPEKTTAIADEDHTGQVVNETTSATIDQEVEVAETGNPAWKIVDGMSYAQVMEVITTEHSIDDLHGIARALRGNPQFPQDQRTELGKAYTERRTALESLAADAEDAE